jgi:hypothetical protein
VLSRSCTPSQLAKDYCFGSRISVCLNVLVTDLQSDGRWSTNVYCISSTDGWSDGTNEHWHGKASSGVHKPSAGWLGLMVTPC